MSAIAFLTSAHRTATYAANELEGRCRGQKHTLEKLMIDSLIEADRDVACGMVDRWVDATEAG